MNRCTFAILLMCPWSLQAEMEFSGFTQVGDKVRFVLVDPTVRQSSGWLEIGQAFRGYELVTFDRKTEVLSVRKDGTTLQLPLRPGPAVELSVASADLAQWLKAVEPPSGVVPRAVYNSARPPPRTPAEEAKLRQIRDERKATVGRLLAPFARAYRNGQEPIVREHLQLFGLLIDASGRAFISPDMNDPTKINQFKTMICVEVWNELVAKLPRGGREP